jgi:cyclophilin family peptidyl-prolyl cis-trans isomerase
MTPHNRRFFGLLGKKVEKKKLKSPARRKCSVEVLEDRNMLSTVGLASIANQTIPQGQSILIPLNATDSGNDVHFLVTSSDNSQVTPTIMPQTNKSVDFNLAGYGTLTFQLFDNLTPTTATQIETLVNDGFYNGTEIYRAQSGFVLQGGDFPPTISNGTVTGTRTINPVPSGVSDLAEEYNPNLTYTTAGDLAMARTSTAGSGETEFFDTEAAARELDFGYTLFGFQTLDPTITVNGTSETIVQAIQNLPTESNSGASYLLNPVTITSASVFTDTQNGVLMLTAPSSATGPVTITVTAYDGTNTPTTQTFTVTPATDSGLQNANPWAADVPATPTSIQFVPTTGTSTQFTNEYNVSSATALQFLVSGVTAGNEVTIYSQGNAIGSAVVPTGQTSVTVTTNGAYELTQGTQTFNATQTALNVSVTDTTDNNLTETADVPSLASSPVSLTIFDGLQITSSPPAATAQVGQVYTFDASALTTNAPTGDTTTITPTSLPAGMAIDSQGNYDWTPTQAQGGTTQTLSISVTDAAGNSTSASIDIVVGTNEAPVEIPASAQGGNVTLTFSGSTAVFYDNIAKRTLATIAFNSQDTLQVVGASGQSNVLNVVAPAAGSALPKEVTVQGNTGSGTNSLVVSSGNGANQFFIVGSTANANGLPIAMTQMQNVQFVGGTGSDYYHLTSSTIPVKVTAKGSNETFDFSKDTGAVTVNLGLDKGQSQSIAPWNTSLSINGVIQTLIGSNYADNLTGGPAATTTIKAGTGNARIVGGTGNNILMGGGGNDTIIGGAKNNTLIAGSGASSLYGGGAGSSNIFVGGTTTVDSNIALLTQVNQVGAQGLFSWAGRQLISKSKASGASTQLSLQSYGAHNKIFAEGGANLYLLGKTDSIL